MATLPLPPTDYEVGWASALVRELVTEFDRIGQPIQVGYAVPPVSPPRRGLTTGTSAVGQVGRVTVSTDGSTDTTVSVSGVGGTTAPTLHEVTMVLATLLRDMRARGVLG